MRGCLLIHSGSNSRFRPFSNWKTKHHPIFTFSPRKVTPSSIGRPYFSEVSLEFLRGKFGSSLSPSKLENRDVRTFQSESFPFLPSPLARSIPISFARISHSRFIFPPRKTDPIDKTFLQSATHKALLNQSVPLKKTMRFLPMLAYSQRVGSMEEELAFCVRTSGICLQILRSLSPPMCSE